MSNVSIYEKNWTDLVFEDRNKEYGAYQLRQENPKTALLAFIVGILFIFALIGSWLLLSSFGEKSIEGLAEIPIYEAITPVNLSNVQKEKLVKAKTAKALTQSPIKSINLSNMVVAITSDAADDIPANALDKNQSAENTSSTGLGIDAVPNRGDFTPTVVDIIPAYESPVEAVTLDRLPEYPGGMKRFYEDVVKNFKQPEVDDNLSSISIIMSFVIEKDGTMSDIKVLRSSDINVEREAIRVLKSMTVKWQSGYKNGMKMRTLYRLPIKVAL